MWLTTRQLQDLRLQDLRLQGIGPQGTLAEADLVAAAQHDAREAGTSVAEWMFDGRGRCTVLVQEGALSRSLLNAAG
jgi:hypothetical protein